MTKSTFVVLAVAAFFSAITLTQYLVPVSAQAPPAQTKWEYKVLTHEAMLKIEREKDQDLQAKLDKVRNPQEGLEQFARLWELSLNRLGEGRWELVSVVAEKDGIVLQAILKRPK